MKLLRNLVQMGSEAKQIPFSRLLSHWKRRLATTLQRENALFILNTSANILYASNRYTPNQDTYIDEVLNESVHCSKLYCYLHTNIIKQKSSLSLSLYLQNQLALFMLPVNAHNYIVIYTPI